MLDIYIYIYYVYFILYIYIYICVRPCAMIICARAGSRRGRGGGQLSDDYIQL